MLTTPSRLVSIASAISERTADLRDRDYRLAAGRASARGPVVRSLLDWDRMAAVDMMAAVDNRSEDMPLVHDSRAPEDIEAAEDSRAQVPAWDDDLPSLWFAVSDMEPRTFL